MNLDFDIVWFSLGVFFPFICIGMIWIFGSFCIWICNMQDYREFLKNKKEKE